MKKYYVFDSNLNLKKLKNIKIRPKKKVNNFLLAKYSGIGYYLITPLLIGVFLGLYLDGRLGTHYLVVIGITVGMIGSIYNLLRLLK